MLPPKMYLNNLLLVARNKKGLVASLATNPKIVERITKTKVLLYVEDFIQKMYIIYYPSVLLPEIVNPSATLLRVLSRKCSRYSTTHNVQRLYYLQIVRMTLSVACLIYYIKKIITT